MSTCLQNNNGKLVLLRSITGENDQEFIEEIPVLKGWESFTGWYWFATEFIQHQDSDLGDGRVIEHDAIWYGFVQGLEEEWSDFSQGEIESLGRYHVWPIKTRDLPHAGRRSR